MKHYHNRTFLNKLFNDYVVLVITLAERIVIVILILLVIKLFLALLGATHETPN